jgi:hypothetical protein
MAKLQEIVSVQASILKSNNGVSIVNHQENPSTPSLPPFNKGNLVAMQHQVLEGVTQQKNSYQSQEKDQIGSLKGPLKRQVVKALKNMKSNEGISDKPLGIQEPCHCCRHYGFPCLQNNSSKVKDKTSQNHHPDIDKKRKAISQEPQLESSQHLGLTAPSHVDKKRKAIPQEPQLESSQHLGLTTPSVLVQCSSKKGPNPKESAVPQVRGNPHKIFLDGWSITYKEFQPWKGKHAKKQTSEISEVKMNSQNQQASDSLLPHGTSLKGAQSHQGSTPVNACFHCQEEGHFVAHCPKKDRASDGLVPHGTSLKGAQSHQGRLGSTPGKAAGKVCFCCQEGGHFVADCPKKYQASDSLVPHGTSLKGAQSHQGSTPGKAAGKACFHCLEEGHLVANCPKKYPLLFGNRDTQKQNLSPSEGKICNQTPVQVPQSSCAKGTSFICGDMDQSPKACKSVTRKLQSPQPSNTPGQHTSSQGPCQPMSDNTSMKSNTPKKPVKRVCYHCREKGHSANLCLQKNQHLLDGRSQNQIPIELEPPVVSDSGAQGQGSQLQQNHTGNQANLEVAKEDKNTQSAI